MRSSGSTKRVGLLIPSSNTVMEVDFYRHLPEGITVHTARMYMESTTPEGEAAMLDLYTMPAARDVATANPDVIVFGCTSAGALRGNAYDRELCRRISDMTGVPVVSVISSVREAIASRGARRVGIVTPYVESLNEKIKESVEADGVEVVRIAGLGISHNFDIGQVTPDEIVRFACDQLAGLDIDLAFMSCTNFRAMEAIPALREKLGLPVVTSNQATFEAVLKVLGQQDASPFREAS